MRRLCLLLAVVGALAASPAATASALPQLPAAGPLADSPPPAARFNPMSPIRGFKVELLG
jgi:hypothetical protein